MAPRIFDCEAAILDIKEYITALADRSISSNTLPSQNHSQSSSELNALKQQVSDLHQCYVRQSQVVNTVLSESNQYHKTTMLVGGMTNFDSKSDAEGWIKKKMQDLGIALPAKIESRSDLPEILICTFESEILRNTAVNTLKNAALNRLWIIASALLYVRSSWHTKSSYSVRI